MKPFAEILQRTFGSAPPPAPEPPPVLPPTPVPEPAGKSVGDPRIAAEAQRIYNPGMPPAPPKPPNPQGLGTVGALDVGGAWGAPEAKS